MCIKTDFRIECLKCGYPYSEAMYPDDGLSCNAPKDLIAAYCKYQAMKWAAAVAKHEQGKKTK